MENGRMFYQIDLLNPGHESCVHAAYDLNCRQYEGLLAVANGRCQMCGIPGACTPHRKLHIDHDNSRGYWAVRGLLCSTCNTHMFHPKREANRLRFLANPWYHGLLSAHGMGLGPYPEPVIGSTVGGPKVGVLLRVERSWINPHASIHRLRRMASTWQQLLRLHGPHHLKALDS